MPYGKEFALLNSFSNKHKPILDENATVNTSSIVETPYGLPEKECIVSLEKQNAKEMFDVFMQIENKIHWSCYQYIRSFGSDTIEYGYTSCLRFNTDYSNFGNLLDNL